MAVMGIGGLGMSTVEMIRSLRRPGAIGIAVATNVAGVPILMMLAIAATRWWSPSGLSDADVGGMVVASLVPCTLASAVVWTRRAAGDVTIPLVTTTVTNLASPLVLSVGVVVMAQTLKIESFQFGRRGEIGPTLVKLTLVVVLPLIAAQLMRQSAGCRRWATTHRRTLSMVAQAGVLVMIAFGSAAGAISQTDRGWFPSISPLVAMLVAMVHVAAFAVAAGGVTVLNRHSDAVLIRPLRAAVGVSASQKTLMVGLGVALDMGVSVAPMIAYHVLQLIIDTVLCRPSRYPPSESDRSGDSEP